MSHHDSILDYQTLYLQIAKGVIYVEDAKELWNKLKKKNSQKETALRFLTYFKTFTQLSKEKEM